MEEKMYKGQKELVEKVAHAHLCTGCGACVSLCPYQRSYEDKIISLFDCDIDEGRCYAFCPRTPTDLDSIRNQLFKKEDLTAEVGALKGFYVARATDASVRENAQHGGTVTSLMALALREGIIDTAVMAGKGESLFLPASIAESDAKGVLKHGKSSFVVSPNVAEFNRVARGTSEKIGMVATPCQALSLAKMRMKPIPNKDNNIEKLKLVIGLFCGWALSWDRLLDLLNTKTDINQITGIDIPPSKYKMMHVYTDNGMIEIPIDEVNRCVRESCNYCFDMTAEFSDISVGSARLPEGWDEAKKWNQIITRTDVGLQLLNLARQKKILEFREVPTDALKKVQEASMKKKWTAVKNLQVKTQDKDDLIYIDKLDPVFRPILK